MSQDYETFREVSQAIGGLQSQINMYAGIFGGVVAVALGGYALIFSKIDVLETSSATLIVKMETIENKLESIEATLARISADTQGFQKQATANPPADRQPTPADKIVVEKIDPSLKSDFFTADGALKTAGEMAKAFHDLPADARVQMLSACESIGKESSPVCDSVEKM